MSAAVTMVEIFSAKTVVMEKVALVCGYQVFHVSNKEMVNVVQIMIWIVFTSYQHDVDSMRLSFIYSNINC
jgi:hypothetical protein